MGYPLLWWAGLPNPSSDWAVESKAFAYPISTYAQDENAGTQNSWHGLESPLTYFYTNLHTCVNKWDPMYTSTTSLDSVYRPDPIFITFKLDSLSEPAEVFEKSHRITMKYKFNPALESWVNFGIELELLQTDEDNIFFTVASFFAEFPSNSLKDCFFYLSEGEVSSIIPTRYDKLYIRLSLPSTTYGWLGIKSLLFECPE